MNKKFDIEENLLKEYLDMHMTYTEIAEKFGCSHWTVMQRAKEYGLKSEARKYQMIENNPMADVAVRQKVSDTIAKMWESGKYDERINGMLGMTNNKNPNFKPEGTPYNYRKKAMFYHPEAICVCCGKSLSWEDKSIEVHHVNEDHDDFTLTNLAPLCHSCHRKYHRKSQPIVQITKSFVFDACHYLPYHDRKCKFLHGHTYHMDITVKNRVLQETGMVMDFGVLKKIVEEKIIEPFDHGFLNQYIEYPTCEIMINWIWKELSKDIKGLYKIKLWETDGSYCEIDAKDMKYYLLNFESDWTKEGESCDTED